MTPEIQLKAAKQLLDMQEDCRCGDSEYLDLQHGNMLRVSSKMDDSIAYALVIDADAPGYIITEFSAWLYLCVYYSEHGMTEDGTD